MADLQSKGQVSEFVAALHGESFVIYKYFCKENICR
jgi:hypothetical protein